MYESDASCRVIDLAEYRARRASHRASGQTSRYLLWYPGVGCIVPYPLASAIVPANKRSTPGNHRRQP